MILFSIEGILMMFEEVFVGEIVVVGGVIFVDVVFCVVVGSGAVKKNEKVAEKTKLNEKEDSDQENLRENIEENAEQENIQPSTTLEMEKQPVLEIEELIEEIPIATVSEYRPSMKKSFSTQNGSSAIRGLNIKQKRRKVEL